MAVRQKSGGKPDGGDDRPAIWAGYGKLVRLFRDKARLTQQELADAVGYSYEQGRRPAKHAFTEAAERVLGTGGVLAALQGDVERAKLPAFFQDFALLETEASVRFAYETVVVPGLLQTEDYARALLAAHCPPLDDEVIDHRLEARLNRQSLLRRKPMVDFAFVISEAALRCPVGGDSVLKNQLQHLLACAKLRNVEVQAMPLTHGAHAGLHGPMVLLETLDQQRVAYFESHGESLIISAPAKVSAFAQRYGKLRSQALNTEDSVRFIERIAGEL
ncbi:helix-turn-helix domain-containing protein [Streptomyces sp. NBC_00444]|uniref:helix-turn-helix domain-containing protein n=1 Tax=Streptomyces sp. NBC_00444 TaxID=2975744 RepID=UPI002E24328E